MDSKKNAQLTEQSKKKRTVLIDRPFTFIWGKCVYNFFYFSGGVIYFLKVYSLISLLIASVIYGHTVSSVLSGSPSLTVLPFAK